MRWFLCLSVMIALSVSSFGQDNPSTATSTNTSVIQNEQIKSEVNRLFSSMLEKDQAWAVYLSGKYGLQENVPIILDLLQRSAGNLQDKNVPICYLAFDSLIQLDATIPAKELMPLYQNFSDEVTILLAKAPKENQEALLTIARQIDSQTKNREYWLAACNLLAETEAKGFAAHLFSEMTIKLSIHVIDSSGGVMGEGIGSSIGCGFGAYAVPEDFPPIGLYDLTEYAKRGQVVVAPGVHPVYYERRIVEPEKHAHIPAGRSYHGWQKNEYLLEYFAALLKTNVEGLRFTHQPSRWIEWKNSSNYKQEVSLIRSEITNSYNALKNRLIERELLSVAESESLTPKIAIRVFDSRGNKRIKLPELSGEVKSLKND
jgi:hypothetical protein